MPLNISRIGHTAHIGNVNVSLMELVPSTDRVIEEIIVTSGYFTDGVGTLYSSSFATASIPASNQDYYVDITNGTATTSKTQFAVAYGHIAGSGSISGSTTNYIGQTQAIYNSFAEMLLPEMEITGGFKTSGSGEQDQDIYVLMAERANMQDAINRKNWTIILSGSATAVNSNAYLQLTDDSNTSPGQPTAYGLRFNVVSGSQGTVQEAASTRNFGYFWPNLGIWVLSGKQLSASIPGEAVTTTAVAYQSASQRGFTEYGQGNQNDYNSLRFFNCLSNSGSIQMRNEEIQQSQAWFCRIGSRFMNFSTNPTFISGSRNELRNKTMQNNPQVYITRLGLYNGSGEVVAVANLSTPLKKNFGTEATIKVKLVY